MLVPKCGKTFTGIELKASVCANLNEWMTLYVDILQYFSFNLPLFTSKDNLYC